MLKPPGIFLPASAKDLLENGNAIKTSFIFTSDSDSSIVGLVLEENSTSSVVYAPCTLKTVETEAGFKLEAEPLVQYPIAVLEKSNFYMRVPVYAEIEAAYYSYLLSNLDVLANFMIKSHIDLHKKLWEARIVKSTKAFSEEPIFLPKWSSDEDLGELSIDDDLQETSVDSTLSVKKTETVH